MGVGGRNRDRGPDCQERGAPSGFSNDDGRVGQPPTRQMSQGGCGNFCADIEGFNLNQNLRGLGGGLDGGWLLLGSGATAANSSSSGLRIAHTRS